MIPVFIGIGYADPEEIVLEQNVADLENRVGFSINTLDEEFKNDMDQAVSIERRLAAMKKLHDAGIRTTCIFIMKK